MLNTDVPALQLLWIIRVFRNLKLLNGEHTMKNLVITSFLVLGLFSSVQAAETVNIHERVNNAQAQAHQLQSSSAPVAIQGTEPQASGSGQHMQAVIAHETMNNGSADSHQKMAASHQKMMDDMSDANSAPSKSFSDMNEHEKAAVAHETVNNGQATPHQTQAEEHRRLSN